MTLHQTPLHALYQGARLTEFSGWEMPVQFSSIKQEHQAVRQAAGMFDISHMGKFVLTGTAVLEVLQQLVPTDLSRLSPGKAQYTVLLNPQGGIIDDLIVYDQGRDLGSERVTLIVNAATTNKDKDWLLSNLAETVQLQDCSRDQALIAVQGPESTAKLQALTADDLTKIPRYGHHTGQILDTPVFFARTGYTGEDGFELMVEASQAAAVWQALLDQGVTPCGLGARDTLRLEAAMALYGQDIADTTTPLEAGLGWLVHLDKPQNFIGRPVLQQQRKTGVSRRLVGLQLEGRNIARHDYPIMAQDKPVGIVTSGTLSPTLGYPIALAYVPSELAKVGQTVEVEIRDRLFPATVVKRPFYRAQTQN
ncbi:glycine cleavage system aminomethyltransferase GcvT [Romeria aff. gracilis LEGE 07310]|uniref:Aminomethyltransferase n=1 Tax=Vasconcelosia minhoensis LEGE 07310 TaxID=915328 RepID=A0A8J7AHC2_9CYAN|nr:glycine cleavage system aminomethyltransferase GcvT [Romeria gracilis]MBE9077563.1 glycine cleavage system aminomethyltransferase GcvT [Romeria aff. gracilis LEGE 07310]